MRLYPNEDDLIECVPNVSEGRNPEIISHIADAICSVTGTQLLHTDSNPDANRTVFTMAGKLQHVLASAENMIRQAKAEIDMSHHTGVHPRIGAVDVCPFVILGRGPKTDTINHINQWSQAISSTYDIPIYLYEDNATSVPRRNLANIRKGNYENLSQKLTESAWLPDFGGARFRPGFGAMVTGVRPLLVAFNVFLRQADLQTAKQIAAELRQTSSSPHALPGVKAIGWYMEGYQSAQVSMNITNLNQTLPHIALESCKSVAKLYGATVDGCELIGLMPNFAVEEAMNYYQVDSFIHLQQVMQLTYTGTQAPIIESILDLNLV